MIAVSYPARQAGVKKYMNPNKVIMQHTNIRNALSVCRLAALKVLLKPSCTLNVFCKVDRLQDMPILGSVTYMVREMHQYAFWCFLIRMFGLFVGP